MKRKNIILFVISEYLEKKYKSIYPYLRVERAIQSMVDLDEFDSFSNNSLDGQIPVDVAKSLGSDNVKLCFAGSCVFTNGLKFVLECLSELKKQGINNFTYYMVFHKGYVSEIQEYIIELGLMDNCYIINGVYPEYIPAIYKQMDVLVMPEMGYVIANAGFPGKTSEYLASGKAIIATNFSDLKLYFIHQYNCMLSEINDHDSYISNMKTLIEDSSYRNSIGKNARLTAENYFAFNKAITPLIEIINRR